MELKNYVDKPRGSLSTHKVKYVQCKRCKEIWK